MKTTWNEIFYLLLAKIQVWQHTLQVKLKEHQHTAAGDAKIVLSSIDY